MTRSHRAAYLAEFTARSLAVTFDERVGTKASTGRDGTTVRSFKKSLPKEIATIRRTALRGQYTPSAYKEHLISKGAGKAPRVLSIPTVRDRLVLRALSQALATLVPDSRTPLAPTVVARLIEDLQRGDFDSYIRLDIKNFYPSVRHSHLATALQKRINSRVMVRQLMRMVRTPTLGRSKAKARSWPWIGVPQGLSISNNLAEISLLDLDARIRERADCTYRRFVDDTLILCDSSSVAAIESLMRSELGKLGLEAHPIGPESKSVCGPVREPFEYLGYRFEWPRITVRQGSISSLKTSLTRVMTAYRKYVDSHPSDANAQARALERCRLRLNLKISGCVYEGTRRGWMAFFSQIRHQQLLKHLDWYVMTEMKRFGLDGKFEPKKFVQSYRCAARSQPDETGFVPNFDDMSGEQARTVLVDYFMLDVRHVKALDDDEVHRLVRARLNRLVSDLDRDTGVSYR